MSHEVNDKIIDNMRDQLIEIDWSSVEIEVSEQDGHDIWGYITFALDTEGNELTVEELQTFEDHPKFYEKLTAQAWGY